MQVRSLKDARELLASSMRQKGFYDVATVEALIDTANIWNQKRRNIQRHMRSSVNQR